MGGNALKTETRRILKEEFRNLQNDLMLYLYCQVGYDEVRPIPYIYNKETFGDLDLLVAKPRPSALKEFLNEELQSKEIVYNGDVVSFEYKAFQVDLIHCPPEEMDMTQTYFSYNDLGMLMGLLAKRLNCKYGTDGLSAIIYSSNREKKWTIPISQEPDKIFKFLGVNYETFLQGFNTLEEVFEFVMMSPYYDTEAFINCSEWNHRRRKRNIKRQNWQKFIEYAASRPKKVSPKLVSPLNIVNDTFPDSSLLEKIKEITINEHNNQVIKSKFDGRLVREITGLEGKELGSFIAYFKSQFSDFGRFCVYNSASVISEEIKHFFQEYKG